MKFAQWLESQTNIHFSFSNDGRVTVYIDGRTYVYITDAAIHNKWESDIEATRRKSPQAYQATCFRILNLIKRLVNVGRAKQEFPKPVSQPQSPLQQKTLF